MADKKTISIEFKEDGSSPSQGNPPPGVPPVDPPNRDEINSASGASPDLFGVFDTSRVDPAALQKTIDELNKEFENLSSAAASAAAAGEESSAATGALVNGASAAAAALGGGGGAGVVGGALGTVGGGLAAAAAGAALALASVIAGGLAFNAAINSIVESIGNLSADVAAASAESRVREIEDRLRLATEAGPEVANLERQRSEIASELRGIYREAIEALAPMLKSAGAVLQTLLPLIRTGFESVAFIGVKVEEFLEFISAAGSNLPVVGDLFKKLNIYLTTEINKGQANNTLQKQIDDLFAPENVGVNDNGSRKRRAKGDPLR